MADFFETVATEESERVRQLRSETSLGTATVFEPDASAPPKMDFFDNIAKEENDKVSRALKLAEQHDPDTYARAKAIADRDSLPVDFALSNLSELQKRETVSKMRPILERNAGLRELLKQEDNGAIFKLPDLERYDGLTYAYKLTEGALSGSLQSMRVNEIRAAQLFGRATPEQIAEADKLSAAQEESGASGFASIWESTVTQLPILGDLAISGARGAVEGGAVGAVAGAVAGGVGAGPGAAVGAGLGAVARTTQATYSQHLGELAGEFFRIRDEDGKPLDPTVIKLAAVAGATLNTSLDMASLSVLTRNLPVIRDLGPKQLQALFRTGITNVIKNPTTRAALMDFAKESGISVATEVSTEAAQKVVQMALGEAAKAATGGNQIYATPEEWVAGVGEAATEALKGTILLGPAMQAPKLFTDLRARDQAQKTPPFVKSLVDAAAKDDLLDKNPAKAKQALSAALGEQVKTLFVPSEKMAELFQSVNVTPDILGQAIPGFAEAFTTARITGGDVEISTADFYAHIAKPFPNLALGLQDHVRLTPEGMSAADEAYLASDDARAEQERAMAEELSGLKAEQERAAPAERVFNDIRDKLVAAGRSADTAQQYATLFQSFFSTLAQRTGGDAFQLYQDRGVDVKFAFPEQLSYQSTDDMDLLLDDLRGGKDKAIQAQRNKALGPSLFTFLRSKGGIQDSGGELKARDVGGALLAKGAKGMNLDDAALAAWEAGYFPEFGETRPSIDDLLEAVDRELSGSAVYKGGMTPDAVELDTEYFNRLDTMGRTLGELGIDLGASKADNARIRQELEAIINRDAEQGALFQFAGVQGAVQLDGAEVPALREAARMQAEGAYPDEIFEATGWFQGVDGAWRFEIADTDATVDLSGFTAMRDGSHRFYFGRLGDVLTHENLFKAYPALADIRVQLRVGEGQGGGSFNADANQIEAFGKDEAGMRSVLLHEIAHAIQETEGFAPGGNLTMGEIYEGEVVESIQSEIQRLEQRSMLAEPTELLTAKQKLVRAAQYEYYRRIAGEVEARNVQERDRLRQAGEDVDTPEWTQDVPNDRQIIISRVDTHGEAMQSVGAAGQAGETEARQRIADLEARIRDAEKIAEEGGDPPDDIFDLYGDVSDALDDYSQILGAQPGGVVLADSRYGLGAMVSRNPDAEGDWRFTRFNKDGFIGHIAFDTKAEAIREAFQEGYRDTNRNLLREMMPGFKREFFQTRSDLGGPRADKRGSIQFGTGRTIINLFEKADLSTFLHESGHFFLEVTRDMALRPGAPQAMVDDWQQIKDWLGLKDDTVTVDAHEQFARGFEAYLFEGKAPSEELRGAFASFRSWLLAIYRKITRLNVNVTPEIKAVFDRMLATEEEIAAADQTYKMIAATAEEAKALGVDEGWFAKQSQLAEQSRQEALTSMQARMLADVKRETTREWQENKKAVREEVLSEFSRMPVYQATHYLRTGQAISEEVTVPGGRMVLDSAYLAARYGKDSLRRLPRGVPPIFADPSKSKRKDVAIVHPDILAEAFGYESGDALVQDLWSAPPLGEAIVQETNLRMRDRYGDMLTDLARRSEEALAAVHTDSRAEFLENEMKALFKRSRQVLAGQAGFSPSASLPARQVMAAWARETIAMKRAADAVRVGMYIKQEQRLAREAEKAILKGDFKAAAEFKRRQLLSHYLALEARRAREDVEGATRYLNKFGNRKRPASVDPEYLDQIEGILERYDMRRSTSLRTIERRKSLADFIQEQENLGNAISIPEKLRNESTLVSYKDITIEDLRALVDGVKNLEHLGKKKHEYLEKGRVRKFQNVKDELAAALAANVDRRERIKGFAPDKGEDRKLQVLDVAASMARIEQVIEWWDGSDINGPARRYIWSGIADAQGKEADLRDKVMAPILKVWDSYPPGYLAESTHFPILASAEEPTGRSLKRSQVFALALNVGTDSNLQRLLEGEKNREGGGVDTMEKLNTVLSTLTAKDWQSIQTIWTQINSLWPEASALEKRETGLTPEKVAARQFEVEALDEAGNAVKIPMQGGYYPIVYDNSQAVDTAAQLMSKDDLKLDPQSLPLTRDKGRMTKRVDKWDQAPPLAVHLDTITRHIDETIHTITHWEAVKQAQKVLRDPEINTLIRNHLGEAFNNEFKRFVTRVWHGDDLSGSGTVQRWISKLRTNAGIFSLAFRPTTVMTQFAGWGPSAGRVGVKPLRQAMATYWAGGPSTPDWMAEKFGIEPRRNPVEDFVFSRSSEMRNRANTMSREVRLGLAKLEGESGHVATMQRIGFMGISVADRWVSVPTWLAGYNAHLAQIPNDEQGAIEAGDRAVRLSQGAGGTKDIPSIMADPRMQPFTMFYGPFNTLFNNLWTLARETKQNYRDGGNREKYFNIFMRSLFFVAAPAVMADALVGKGPDEEDIDEEGYARAYATWAAAKIAFYPLATIPLVRDAASGMQLGFAPQASPAGRLSEAAIRTGLEIGKGTEANPRALAKNAADTAGLLFGLPIGFPVSHANKIARRIEEDDMEAVHFFFPGK